ncbi:hypothetical protein [Fibrobacter sp.]|uniref:hypothetical protein n=1 Tax=Fibrobacter sp. TaxID=35828 RepID=UPI00388DBB43
MADRLIFTIKHQDKTLAYLYQRWGRGDGATLEAEVRKAAEAYHLDLTNQADAIQAIRLAGEQIFGHAIWNGGIDDTDDEEYIKATQEDRDYLESHRDNIVADNQCSEGITFFYGISAAYPPYIESWCEDSYSMTV